MLNRRTLLTLGTLALAACGEDTGRRTPATETEGASPMRRTDDLAVAEVALARPDPATTATAAQSVTAFTGDLYRRVAADTQGNLVISPYSVIVALGMTLQGARGETADQLRRALHATDDLALAGGLGGLRQTLAARAGRPKNAAGNSVELQLSEANSLWGQRGERWQEAFLSTLGRHFGTGMNLVDYIGHTEQARVAINTWVAQQTHQRITDLVPRDALSPEMRLTLVNAIYLKAGWLTPFEKELTRPRPFTRPDGSAVQVPMMSGDSASYGAGPGWVATDLVYAGKQLAMTIVLPDPGRLGEIERGIDAAWVGDVVGSLRRTQVAISLPRWKTRSNVSMRRVLKALGVKLAFEPSADFTGMTTQERLSISDVLHQGYLAVDEYGTEAAAATAVIMREVSAPARGEEMIADRPFLYLLRDLPTGTPLFIGRVNDPTA